MRIKEINQQVFFELLKAGLWGKSKDNANANQNFSEGVDWEKVCQLAQEQSVQGLVLQGIEWLKNANVDLSVNVPQILLLKWIGEVQMIEQKNRAMNAFVANLIEKLRNADVYTLLVKGQGVAQCYEKPMWRSCGDIDLFLSDNNYENAKKFLMPLASEVETEYIGTKHLGIIIDGWVVELHGHLYSGLSSRVEKELDRLQEDTFYGGQVRSWMNGQTQIFQLKAENDAFYVFTHILQHFYKGGIGLRQICDWCRLLYTFKKSLNYGLLEHRIKRAGLITEWKAFATLAVEYLGMPVDAMPFYSDSDMWKKKAERIIEFVMMTGNMGHNRDMSYFSKRSYLIRKYVSMNYRIDDIINHVQIFPMDSLRFFLRIMFNGVRSAVRGE